jgi:hypothetical protein
MDFNYKYFGINFSTAKIVCIYFVYSIFKDRLLNMFPETSSMATLVPTLRWKQNMTTWPPVSLHGEDVQLKHSIPKPLSIVTFSLKQAFVLPFP